MSVFKGRHKFNKKIRNGKRHVRIFPAGGDPAILPTKIAFHGGVGRDVLFAEKVVLYYRCKTRHMLGENCPVVSPTPEGSDMSYTEQSETPRDNKSAEKADPSVENQPSAGSGQEMSSIEERIDGDDSSTDGTGDDSDSESTSELSDEDGSELGSSVPETPLQKPVAPAPKTNLASKPKPSSVENQKSNDSTKCMQHHPDTRTISQKPKLKSLRDFKISHPDRELKTTDIIDRMNKSNLTVTIKDINITKEIISIIIDLLYSRTNTDYLNRLTSYTVRLQTNHFMKFSPDEFDDYLYVEVVPRIFHNGFSRWNGLVISMCFF